MNEQQARGMLTRYQEAETAFRAKYKGHTNFMTPEFVWLRRVGPYAVELSKGSGLSCDVLWGVTVVLVADPNADRSSICGCFESRVLALRHVDDIRKGCGICLHCDGEGYVEDETKPCASCNGTGGVSDGSE